MNCQQQASSPPAQDFPVVKGSLLSSSSSSYQVQSFLGEGSFGKVAKCIKTATNKTVAVKIFKGLKDAANDAQREVAILKKLRALDPDTCNIVQLNTFFIHQECMCLEFEILDISLRDFMKQRMYQPLPLKEIRPILHQLATALKYLKSIRIIHADLKPENIMIVDHQRQPLRVKLIDFGLACEVSAAIQCSLLQSRWYRSPEIMLGLPFSEAIDMWSLGLVAAALFIGVPLYNGSCDYDMMRFIVETQGQPPDHLLNSAKGTFRFFESNTNSTGQLWRLKTPEEVWKQEGIQSKDNRRFRFRSLDDFKHFRLPCHPSAANSSAEFRDRWRFVDMVKQMLQLDARTRITPSELLEHPFITMRHLVDIYHECTQNTKADLQPSSTTQAASIPGPPNRTDEGMVLQGNRKRSAESLAQTGSKRARVEDNTGDNRGRNKTDASGTMAQTNGNTSMSQTGTLSPQTLRWHVFVPKCVASHKAARPQ